jgi:hypothetical protein
MTRVLLQTTLRDGEKIAGPGETEICRSRARRREERAKCCK